MLALVLFFVALHAAGRQTNTLLEFDRDLIQAGAWWRLLTGNLVHYGLYHTAMNGAGLAAVVAVLYWHLPLRYLVVGLVVIPLGVGSGLYWSDIEIYRGFSGTNYGLLALGLLLGLPYNRRLYTLALLILLGKIVMEQLPGYDVNYLRDRIGVAVAVESHLAGFCTGILMGSFMLFWRARINTPRPGGS